MLGRLSGPARGALAPISGAVVAAGFLVEPGVPLVLVGLAALFALWATGSPARGAIEGMAAGLVLFGILLRWFAAAILDFSDLPGGLAVAAVVSSACVLAAGTAVAGATVGRVARRAGPGAALAAAPVLWFGHELLRAVFPLPFPWAVLSASAALTGAGNDVARDVGAHGLSLGLAIGAAALAAVLVAPRRGWPAPFLWLLLAGGLVLVDPPLDGGAPVRVGLVQGSLPRQAHPVDKLRVYRELTAQAAEAGARLVVWPESAVPYRVDSHPGYRRDVERLARRLDVDLLVGTLSEAREAGALRNSAALIRASGGVATVSSKRQLVPFGEYLPMSWLFGGARALAAEAGSFVPGERVVLHPARGQRVACLVCYEAVFPGLAAEAVDAGAGLLANITNDSWFGWTSGPRQHLLHSTLRAAETGRPLIRAANSGISVILGARGELVGRLGLGERGILTATVTAGAAPAPGYFVGRWVARACATLSFVVLGAAWLPARIWRGPSAIRRRAPRDENPETDRPSDGKADA